MPAHFTHLHVHSCFSFLDGASWPQDLIARAVKLEMDSLALTDHDGLYGAVRFYTAARAAGITPILGAEITLYPAASAHTAIDTAIETAANSGPGSHCVDMADTGSISTDYCSIDRVFSGRGQRKKDPPGASHLTLLAADQEGYRNLCRLLTRGHLRGSKGAPLLIWEDLQACHEHLFALSGCPKGEIPTLLREGQTHQAMQAARRYLDLFGTDRFLIEMQNHLLPDEGNTLYRLNVLARSLGLRTVATNNVHYAVRERYRIHDVLTSIRTLTPLDGLNAARRSNAEYSLKSSRAMSQLFRDYPEAISNTRWVAEQCSVDLGLGELHFPRFPLPDGETAYSYLCKLCFDGARERYQPLTPEVLARLQHELEIIHDLGFAEYFLVVWDITRFAREGNIRYSGRGSAVNSILTYCLGVTTVDPIAHNLLFERFLNRERRGVPDVDIDFCARRRDEVLQYVYQTYGSEHVAMVCTLSTLNARSALRDVGRALGIMPGQIDRLAKSMPHTGARHIRAAMAALPELRDAGLDTGRMGDLFDICEAVDGFPRHMSVHLAGMLITRAPLTDYTPMEWSTKGVVVAQFNKDDVETLGLVKLDILGLRNLTALEDGVANIREARGIEVDLDHLPPDDPRTYSLLRSTETVGVFQLESPGMRGLLGRLQPERFEDIIANVALFRPGPMKANMIDPFIGRRQGREAIVYLHPCLEPVLRETYGVLIFQEQVLRIASAIAGFTMGQADRFRRAMTHNRSPGEMEAIRESFLAGAAAREIPAAAAEQVFEQLASFAAYGFCKAHAAAFGQIAYQTAYLKANYPAEFLAGILSNIPMGFYSASTIVHEAKRLGIPVLSVDVNRSRKRCAVEWLEQEPGKGRLLAIRISLSVVRSMTEEAVQKILVARQAGYFTSLRDFCVRTRVDRPIIENLVRCGAFDHLPTSFTPATTPTTTSGARLTTLPGGATAPQASISQASISQASQRWTSGSRGPAARVPAAPAPAVRASAAQSIPSNTRRRILWQLEEILKATADLEPCLIDPVEIDAALYQDGLVTLPPLTPTEIVRADYHILGMTTYCHPLAFYRDTLRQRGIRANAEISQMRHGSYVRAAGIVISCMKPPTRSGKIIVFVTLEDETGLLDVTVFPKVYDRYGYPLFSSTGLIIEGRLERLGPRTVNLVAEKVEALEPLPHYSLPLEPPDCPSGFRGGPIP